MRGQYIEFISSYCDGWCERCAFTTRCSVYAVQTALEMCDGNAREALELALGNPPPLGAAEARRRERRTAEQSSAPPTERALAEVRADEDGRDERVAESPVSTASERAWMLAHRWLSGHAERASAGATPALAEAIQVASHDCLFIHAKVQRALRSRDRHRSGKRDDHHIQNDWNGSAKVALISITRSIAAWDLIGNVKGDPEAAQVADELRMLQRQLEQVFPNARKFRRPGFDEPRVRQGP